MKRSRLIALAFAAFAIGIVVRGCFISSPPPQTPATAQPSGEEVIWTCSMHPQIRQPNPGTCPLCGMDLIPVSSGASQHLGPRQLALSPAAEAIAKIETTPVERRFVEADLRMVGTISYDETRTHDVTLLSDGVVERLFVNYAGVRVKKGDHLAEIYSPEVFAAQKELLAAQRAGNTDGARQKLRLLGVLDDEIDAVMKSGEARRVFTVRSPATGVLVSKSGNEGHWLNRGDTLATITDNATVWTLLDAYESDLPFIHYGQRVELTVEAVPGRQFTGYVAFIPPELDSKTRTAKVRLNVPNEEYLLKPGMFAHATLRVRISTTGQVISSALAGKWICEMHPEIIKDGPGNCDNCGMPLVSASALGFTAPDAARAEAPLVIPDTAPLLTGKRAIVYVADPQEPGVYEGREVVLGLKAGPFYVVEKGLREGERVVTRGTMKIDSAIQLQARPSMMNPPPEEEKAALPEGASAEDFQPILSAFLDLTDALANDQLEPARAAAQRISDSAGHLFHDISDVASRIAAHATLDGTRESLGELSDLMIKTARAFGDTLREQAYVMFCPMAYDDQGAEWMQREKKIHNPYFGEEMPGCGKVRGTIGAEE